MSWNEKELENHKKAAKLLIKIKDEAFEFIRKNSEDVSEYDVAIFIRNKYKEYGLKSDREGVIVSFGSNTSFVHYFPRKKTAKKLEPETLIMIDIWARLKQPHSPYADITWMGYCGRKIPKEVQKVFDTVIKTRDACLDFIQNDLRKGRLPIGKEVESYHVELLTKAGYGDGIDHFVGHSIGFHSPHGKLPGLTPMGETPLLENLGYTDEPGIYIDGEFGVRSEIDFYIDTKNEVVITTEVQKEIVIL